MANAEGGEDESGDRVEEGIAMILRNLKSLIRRYPVAVVLNFTGLVAALLAFALIFLQADYELSFDKCHPTADRVFRADMVQITSEGLMLYLRTVAICYVIAAPVGWLVVRYYLQQFSHRVGFMPSVFLLALVIVGLLCAAVVLYHYLKTARMNPAEALKNE